MTDIITLCEIIAKELNNNCNTFNNNNNMAHPSPSCKEIENALTLINEYTQETQDTNNLMYCITRTGYSGKYSLILTKLKSTIYEVLFMFNQEKTAVTYGYKIYNN